MEKININNIRRGDTITLINNIINGGLRINVEEVNKEKNEVKCYIPGKPNEIGTSKWFSIDEIESHEESERLHRRR